jgi:DNA helicase HerA-like ATPase
MAKEGKLQIIKYAPPPPELPILGKSNSAEVSYIGRTNYAAGLEEKKFIFGLKRIDRRHHLHIIGKGGVGKSKFLELLIRQDIAAGKGVCVIDPHGDLTDAILDFIPESRMKDVCFIDPSDVAYPLLFNPLVGTDKAFHHQLAQGLIEVMKKQFIDAWTPRLEHIFRFTIFALLDYPHPTMRGMISLLTDEEYRAKVIPYIEDEMIKRFWVTEFPEWAKKFDTEAIIPLVSKLSQFFSHPLLRSIFSQEENKINLDVLVNENAIILVNLAKGKIGEENSSFLGSLLLMRIRQVGMGRATMPEWARKDFYIYIDEFQNFITETFEQFLSEARKYGLCLTVSHQYLGQLEERVQAALLASVGSLVVFRVGGEDAETLEGEMTPIFKAKDMINLGLQEFYIKMTIDGETCDPFSADTLKVLQPTHSSHREDIIKTSRARFATAIAPHERKGIEEKIISPDTVV